MTFRVARPHRIATSWLALGAGLAAQVVPVIAVGQVATMDEGRFTITRNGHPIGREEFNIRRTTGVDTSIVYVASGTATYGDRRVTSGLRVSAQGAPIAYALDVRVGAASVQRVRGQLGRGRFASTSRTSSGESSREDVVGRGTVIVDDELFHHYYFLLLDHSATGSFLLVPRRSARLPAQLEQLAADSVDIAGRAVAAAHFRIRQAGGDRDVWVDDRGRVLKVSLDDGVIAIRDEPPR